MSSSAPSVGHVEDGSIRVLPDAAYEVSTILIFSYNDEYICIGNIQENGQLLPPVIVRLGTKVSDLYPSCVGFRIMLRTEASKTATFDTLEDYYHVVSCKFRPYGNPITHAAATKEDKQELMKASTHRNEQNLYRIDFKSSTSAFDISRHGGEIQAGDPNIRKVVDCLPYIVKAKKVSLFFAADEILVAHLTRAIHRNCVGVIAPCWKDSLPDNAVLTWASNRQTRMVAGSTDVVNILRRVMREAPLKDGPGTSLNLRPQAQKFKKLVDTYPRIVREQGDKVYPVMLNVVGGLCIELPFGASMFNRENTYAAINALHKLLRNGIIPGSDVGIVALYPSQVQVYHDALQLCHRHNPVIGYNTVKVDVLENWVGKETGIAIVDLVRTPNASGNLGLLSQARRLEVLLTLHRDGLIVVGDRKCTTTSQGNVSSTKLEKVLQWFEDNGRIVDVSNKGLPQPDPATAPSTLSSTSILPPHLRTWRPTSQTAPDRNFVGLPGFENLQTGRAADNSHPDHAFVAKAAAPKDHIYESFTRQGFHPVGQGPPPKFTFKEYLKNINYEAQKADHLVNPARDGLLNNHSDVQARDMEDSDAEQTSPLGTFRSKIVPQGSFLKNTVLSTEQKNEPRVEAWTKRFNEKHTSRHSDHSRSRNRAESDLSSLGRAPSRPATYTDFNQALVKRTHITPTASVVGDENARLVTPQTHRTKLEEVSSQLSPQIPRTKLPTINRETSTAPSLNAKLETLSDTTPSIGVNAKPPLSSGKVAQGSNPTTPTVSNALMVRNHNINQPQPQQKADFKDRYRAKYQAIRSIFDSIHNSTDVYPSEDHLFRRLGEAYITEDARAFDHVYVELLGMAKGLHLATAEQDQ